MKLDVSSLSASYGSRRVLHGASFDARPGEVIGIFGPNGAGKSTLLKALLGLIPRDGGSARLGNRPLASGDLAYMPQRADLDWDYPAVVEQVVEMGGWRARGLFGWWLARPPGLHDAVLGALDRLNLADLRLRQIGELSGGQRQRVLLARTLVRGEAPVLLLDEPFAAVDKLTEQVLWDEVRHQADAGRIVVIVHHELAHRGRFDRVLLLGAQGQAAFGAPHEVFTDDNLGTAYCAPATSMLDAFTPTGHDDARRAVHRAAA